MKYIDGFVLPVPKDKLAEYKKMASKAGEIWMKHGALQYIEAVGDDLNPDTGGEEILTFPNMVKPNDGETIIFAFIVYESREHRDEVNEKVMNDPMMNPDKKMEMPFDMKRMAYGGFSTIVDFDS